MKSHKFKDLNEFLSKHSSKNTEGGEITHTRIGSKELTVYGGSYCIPTEDRDEFYDLYYRSVFLKKRVEYLTEKQLSDNGPIAIDFDFRYNHDVETRKHTKEHIQDILALIYLEIIKEFFLFEESKPFSVYVFEKPDVNRLADGSLTKDGIHMIIGIKMDHIMQIMLRDKVLQKIPEICDLPLINTWDSVLDEGISKGTTNWQLYGSRKPGNAAYELTQHYEITYDSSDGEFMMVEKKISEFDLEKDFKKLSVQYADHPGFEINPKIENEYNARKNGSKSNAVKLKKSKSKTKIRLLCENEEDEQDDSVAIEDIVDSATLNKAVAIMLNEFGTSEYELKEIHEYTQILPEKYYEPGSHLLNTQVAFALKHTDDRLFLSWVKLRSKASDFDYNSIPDLLNRWKKHFKERKNGITKKSIIYWAKQDAFNEYEKVRENTVSHFINESLNSPTEFDFGIVLYHMFKDKYVCSSITNKTWYEFKKHRWVPDLGQSLRMAISVEMYLEYSKKISILVEELQLYTNDSEDYNSINKRIQNITLIAQKLKRTTDKNNIMREAAEIFYDKMFVSNMDTNKYLMCFNNGVIDFENKTFRDGYPQDYITKSTNIDYVPYDEEKYSEEISYVDNFMNQLFPVKTLNKYMWEHLASTLIGENLNQTFNIYRGSGSNGKSLLADLMSQTLGEYKGTVPITLVTDKRNSIGGTSSEIMQLKGIRYAVMQEPSKGAKINDGVMKELTGGDPIQGRALYCDMETFTLQCSLVVCTNVLFEVESNDDGVWRRIRLVDFMSKFVDPGTPDDPDNPYQFPKDKNLKDKLLKYVKIFASKLVKIAFETNGHVEDCDIVMASSNKYRQGQDHISAFVSEMVRKCEGKTVKMKELTQQFNVWFQEQQGSRKIPKGVEVCEYMDKKFGPRKKTGWKNVEIIYPDKEDEIEEVS
uniref:SF3 helicase domain-containing protein n=1 Tax=viral metagenome TaxID=1070528 RepID=A0A6C0KUH8_9ZZZZ